MARERIRPKARAGSSGFTLVETIVAVGLALVIMSVVIVVFRQGLALFRRTRALTEAVHSAQVALDFIEQDIQSLIADDSNPLVGVVDATTGKVDNDDDGTEDEDGSTIGQNRDCVDFLNTFGMERHGLEMVTMSLFAMDDVGNPVAGEHVLYYLTRDRVPTSNGLTENGNGVGRLIRHRAVKSGPVTAWLGDLASVVRVGRDKQDERTVAFGVVQFRIRYFYQGVWYDAWDSTDQYGADGIDDAPTGAGVGGDDVQWQRPPEAVEVTLQVVDERGYLDRVEATPLIVQRLIQVSTAAP